MQHPLPIACSGNVLELLEDIQELRPTIFSSVPRLWNRIYDKVMAQVGSELEKCNCIVCGCKVNHLFWNRIYSDAAMAGACSAGRSVQHRSCMLPLAMQSLSGRWAAGRHGLLD